MWIMYIGINGINAQSFVQLLYKAQPDTDVMKLTLSDSIKSNKLHYLHLFQCFMEAKCQSVPKEISSMFHNDEINFRCIHLLPYHISSLTLYISKHPIQLQSLNLRDCHIGDVGMNILEQFFTINPDKASSIKHIDLFGNNSVLLWKVYCAIFEWQNLKKLNWSSLGGVNIEEILTVVDNNVIIQSLNLSGNHFKDEDAERIGKILYDNKTLQELDFSNNEISTSGAIAISEYLQNSDTCKCLKLSWNSHFIDTDCTIVSFSQKNIKDIDVRILAKLLSKNETVTKLNLSRNRITGNGAESISKCIESNKSLKEIDISGNKIADIGLGKIVVALQTNQTLQNLNISHNNMSDVGAVAISECLRNNHTLQYLNMSHNKVSDNGIINIGKALQVNKSLLIFDISYNNISDSGVFSFSDYLKKKKRISGTQNIME